MTGNRRLRGARTGLAHLLVVLVAVQALIAGRALIGEWDIAIHGVLGNVSYVVAIAALALALVARAGRAEIGLAATMVVLVTTQIGLGYMGRETLEARAWHVPLGVLIFGAAVATSVLAAVSKRLPAPGDSHLSDQVR